LPPLSGFIAKFAILSSAIAIASPGDSSVQSWALVATLLAAGLVGIIAFTRIGIRIFWSTTGQAVPRVRVIEAAPVAFLLVICVGLTVAAGPAMKYLDATAAALHTPRTYIDAVLPPSRELIAKKEPAP
jgi:multicomponent K+:H+ antiporter subunit D